VKAGAKAGKYSGVIGIRSTSNSTLAMRQIAALIKPVRECFGAFGIENA
jgi:hypothetical protein